MYRKYKHLKSQLLGEAVKETQLPKILPQSSKLCKETENVQKGEVFGAFLNKKRHEERHHRHDRTEPTSYKARKWVPGRGFKTVVVTTEKPHDEGQASDVANREGLSTEGVTRSKGSNAEHNSKMVIFLSSGATLTCSSVRM